MSFGRSIGGGACSGHTVITREAGNDTDFGAAYRFLFTNACIRRVG
jgi:hypothetical protein